MLPLVTLCTLVTLFGYRWSPHFNAPHTFAFHVVGLNQKALHELQHNQQSKYLSASLTYWHLEEIIAHGWKPGNPLCAFDIIMHYVNNLYVICKCNSCRNYSLTFSYTYMQTSCEHDGFFCIVWLFCLLCVRSIETLSIKIRCNKFV